MSKEYLEALEHIYYGSQGYGETDKYYKFLKNYLEAIDNSNPSEALENIGNIDLGDNPYKTFEHNKLKNVYSADFNAIKQALLQYEQDKKELEEYRLIKRALGHYIYDANGKKWYIEHYYSENGVKQLHSVRCHGNIIDMKFNLYEYKKTFWLKEDKSE